MHKNEDTAESPAAGTGTTYPPPRPALVDRIIASFDLLMQRMTVAHAPDFIETAMTMSQAKVLYLVAAAGSVRLWELAGRLGVAPSTTSGVVDRLVEAGLLDRHDDPTDRRQLVITLTHEGAARLERMRELNADHLRVLLDHVDDADLPILDRAVAVFANAAASMGAAHATPERPIPTTREDRP